MGEFQRKTSFIKQKFCVLSKFKGKISPKPVIDLGLV